MWKFCGKAQFPHSVGRIAQDYAETVLFHNISAPGNLMKLRYFPQWLCHPLRCFEPAINCYMYCTSHTISTRPQKFILNPVHKRIYMLFITLLIQNLPFKVSFSEYFLKFGEQTKNNPLNAAFHESFIE